MRFETAIKSGVSYGKWITLDHEEVLRFTGGMSAKAITSVMQPMESVSVAVVAANIYAQAALIKSKDESSGGKGVKLFFDWAKGAITSISPV